MSLHTVKLAKKKGKGSTGSSFDNLEIFLLHLPTTIWYLLFCYAPMFGVIIAFKNYKPRPGKSFLWALFNNSKWVGLDNFKFRVNSSYFPTMLKTTVFYNIVFIILGIVIPVTLAILFSEIYSKKLAKTCQTMMFLPHFLSWVVVSYFVYAFLATEQGLVNNVLHLVDPATGRFHNWYHDTNFWMYFLVFLNVWKGMGYNMVVYMASISGIDGELYEAAFVDGADRFMIYHRIVMPLIRPALATVAIYNLVPIWNDLWFPLIFITKEDQKTVLLAVTMLQGQYSTDWPKLLTILAMSALPVITLYLLMCKQFVKGRTAGAVKG